MEFKIKKLEMLKGIGLMQGIAIERKTTMPILANILLTTNDKLLSITATDTEVGLNCILAGDIITPGNVLVHAKSIYDIVRELPESEIRFSVTKDSWIEIVCGKSRYKIVGLPTDEFPALPSRNGGDIQTLPGDLLKGMLDKASFAMSTDETRFNLNGVYLDPLLGLNEGKTRLRMMATDGHRLSVIEREIAGCKITKAVIIPRKGVSELKKLVDGPGNQVDLWLDEKHLIAYKNQLTLIIRLIDGQFPPCSQIIPKQSKHIVTVKRDDLIHALKRVSVLTNHMRGVTFCVSPKNLEISTVNPDIGEAHEELEVAYRGETFEVGFNPHYFLDALNVVEDDNVVLQMGDDAAPCVIRSELDLGFTHAIMPVRR